MLLVMSTLQGVEVILGIFLVVIIMVNLIRTEIMVPCLKNLATKPGIAILGLQSLELLWLNHLTQHPLSTILLCWSHELL